MTRLFRWPRALAILAMDWLVTRGTGRVDRGTAAIVKLDAIGDFVLWLASAKAYSRILAGKRTTLLANSECAELARRLPYWDDVMGIEVRRLGRDLRYRWKILRRVREAGFDVAIQPTCSRYFWEGDSVIRATGAPVRIGSQGDLSNIPANLKAISDRWYTRLVPAAAPPVMELERNREFLRGLGAEDGETALGRLPSVARLPEDLRVDGDYFIVFPGASWSGRMWPARLFGEAAHHVGSTRGWRLVVCGTAGEADLARSVVESAGLPSALNLAGRTALPEFVELARGARLLVGNETSAVHIAAAVGTPSVCLLGGGHFGRFVPYPESDDGEKPHAVFHPMPCFGCNWACHQPHRPGDAMPCVAGISVQSVIASVERAMSGAGRSLPRPRQEVRLPGKGWLSPG